MNKEHILKLAAHIEGLTFKPLDSPIWNDEHFAMNRYRYVCGSPSCIAGHAAVLAGKRDANSFLTGLDFLELDEDTARALFDPKYGGDIHKPIDDVTPQEAAAVLRRLAQTGKVDWVGACNDNLRA